MRASVFAIVALVFLPVGPPAVGLELARDGRALTPIRIAGDASAVDRHAADELASYLEKITGAVFAVETGPGAAPSIEVGWTEAVRSGGSSRDGLGPERWIVRTVGDRLWLTGGAPRGALYAVYRFLEDDLGVEWWTPWDETVPRKRRLKIAEIDRTGEPFFAYRDGFGIRGSIAFHARQRLNGHYSRIPADRGGSLRFGPPFHVHTFDRRIPAKQHFERHPEWFSEIGGFRFGGETQWCMTSDSLLEAVEAQVRESIVEGERVAEQERQSRPVFYDVSQNDWGRHCECGPCSAIVGEEGSHSGPLIRFVNRLARLIHGGHPDLLVSTLAYGHTFDPPRTTAAAGPVLVRLADLYQRDFARGLLAPSNAAVREAVRGWAARSEHLHVWDYRVTFHDDGDLPRGDHAWLGERFRFYADQGVEGVLVQTEFADVADMRDLEVWLIAKLLEDPYRDDRKLIRRFLKGYYGPAAGPIAAYLEDLARAVEKSDAQLDFAPPAGAFRWLDRYVLERAHRRFEVAERRVSSQPQLLARVRGARVALDRATLALWERLWPQAGVRRAPWPRAEVGRRYAATRRARIEQRLFGQLEHQALDSLADEMKWMERP